MAGERALFKFLKPGQRLQPADVQAAAMWGVAATTGALWLIQGENLVCRVVPVIEAVIRDCSCFTKDLSGETRVRVEANGTSCNSLRFCLSGLLMNKS
ncbi:hypothetical protein Gotri_028173 [Gossypium trilobum]|uniref:Uncharacterized protein n=1 Tax=Gossypium trilobum TaxID=34281 RepID=A0A7J9FNP4_9ROSI|nr:hypothetical protein [Gossypium trilobum]